MRSVLLAAILLVAACTATTVSLHRAKQAPTPWRHIVGDVKLDESIDMVVALRRRNLDRLESILLDVSNPSSANYGNHLNHEQMTALVSPGKEAVSGVVGWLQSHGAKGIVIARHEDSITFTATRAQVEKLLRVKFELFEEAGTKRRLPRALGETHIPAALASVIEIIAGHRGFPLPKEKRPKPTKTEAGSGSGSGSGAVMNVTPALLYSVYNETTANLPATPAGVRNIQSFFQAQGQFVQQSDLTTFCQELLPMEARGACNISKYIGADVNNEPGIESSLDSEFITATGYGLETWAYSYQNVDFCQDLLHWGQDVFGEKDGTFPYVISMSYGSQRLPAYCDGDGQNRINADTMKMGAMGISVIIASGDNGSGEDSRSQWNWGFLGTSFPAELPYVTAVGSTTFISGDGGAQRAATFSGGGFSFYWGAPAYQQSAISMFFDNNTQIPPRGLLGPSFNASGRGTPDVSFLGENFLIISGGVEYFVAGTSCSTPSFAGMIARLNNLRLQNNKTLGFLNPLLYANPTAFTDITVGTNDMNHDGYGWYCKAGWDPVSGLGTPQFGSLVSVVSMINEKEVKKSLKH